MPVEATSAVLVRFDPAIPLPARTERKQVIDSREPRKRKVELHDAFWFTCEECGRDCYISTLPSFGKTVSVITARDVPTKVECEHCRAVFKEVMRFEDAKTIFAIYLR